MLLDSALSETVVDPRDAAESAGLTYVSDEEPGIRRKKAGTGFTYIRPGGGKVDGRGDAEAHPEARHPAGLDRRVDLRRTRTATSRRPGATPRAASSTATTRDFRAVRESTKYEHMLEFAQGPAGDPRDDRRAHGAARPAARKGAGDGRRTCSRTR